MKLKPIVKGLAQAVALAWLLAPNAVAQQQGGGAAGVAPKGQELSRVPGKSASAQPVSKGSPAAGKASAGPAASGAGTPAGAPAPGFEGWEAKILSVEGNALVSAATGLVAGNQGLALREGGRVIAAANTKMIVAFNDGCQIQMKANQRLEITSPRPCSERIFDLQSILIEPAVVSGLSAGGLALSGALQTGVGLSGLSLAAKFVSDRITEKVSPN